MSRSKLTWIVARTLALAIATYVFFPKQVITAEACVTCANIQGTYACISVPSGYAQCTPAGNGCLTFGDCGC